MDLKKLENALGKRRMAKVDDIMMTENDVDIQLTNLKGDVWSFIDFSNAEIIFYAKRFIDENGGDI